jgi:mitochondrial fusion and transport protein UGO1
VIDEAVIPQYIIPVGSAAGATGMMMRLKNFEPEGWLSLWKGKEFVVLS